MRCDCQRIKHKKVKSFQLSIFASSGQLLTKISFHKVLQKFGKVRIHAGGKINLQDSELDLMKGKFVKSP